MSPGIVQECLKMVGLISKNFTTTDGFGFVIISAASRHCWRILYGRQRDSVKWKEGLTNQHLRNAWLHCIIDFHGWIQRGIVNMGKSLSHHSHEGHGECEVVVEMSHRYELHETSGIKKNKTTSLKKQRQFWKKLNAHWPSFVNNLDRYFCKWSWNFKFSSTLSLFASQQ